MGDVAVGFKSGIHQHLGAKSERHLFKPRAALQAF
jgi:hypothetical protein